MYLGIYEGERRVVCDLCHILRFWVLERGLVITGDQVAVNYAEHVMGVTAQQTRQTEHPLPEYRGHP